jgi:hypothetical protein
MRKKQRLAIACVIFVFATLLFTRIDYLINCELYKYGLQYSDAWFAADSIVYFLLFQMVIVWIYLFTRSWKLCVVLEAFVLPGGQDLIFYGVWGKMQFPTGEWTWMLAYKLFGTCTTQIQVAFTGIATLVAIIFVRIKS